VFSSAANASVGLLFSPTDVHSYFRSAVVKVMALLALPAARTNASPRLAAAVLCRAAVWRPLVGRIAAAKGSADRRNSCSGV